MTSDPFVTFDAAYVLGALSDEDRRAFEAHLVGCDSCAQSVASLAGLPALLASVPASAIEVDDDDAPPTTLLPRLLREVRGGQRRRRWLAGALAGAAAACIVGGTAAVAYHSGSNAQKSSGRPMTKLINAPLHASANIVSVGSGSRIDVWCTYDASEYSPGSYWLVIHSRDGQTQELATWPGVPGKTMVLHAPTTWARSEISSVQITGESGKPLLTLSG